ncbi:MAG: hypothetical protein QY323_03490 [Patescibacteria group bacterium]|nr:MAG: hypothetical protein QY323_03490 [Patescibacteria group bacterium]
MQGSDLTFARSTLSNIHRASKSTREKRAELVRHQLVPLRAKVEARLRESENAFAIPYLDEVFDGLRDAVVDGKDARIALVDVLEHDISQEEADRVSDAIVNGLSAIECAASAHWAREPGGRAPRTKMLVIAL